MRTCGLTPGDGGLPLETLQSAETGKHSTAELPWPHSGSRAGRGEVSRHPPQPPRRGTPVPTQPMTEARTSQTVRRRGSCKSCSVSPNYEGKGVSCARRSAAPEDHSPGAPRGWPRENFQEPTEGLRPPAPGPWTPPGHEGPGLPRYVFSPGDTPGIAGQPWNCLEPASSRLHESPFCAGGSGPPPTER